MKYTAMKKILSLLLCSVLVLSACNESSEPKSVSKDSAHTDSTDSFNYNPATPPAQNSDDPTRFSQ
jgi:outer membrane lipoprotein-sorting protein